MAEIKDHTDIEQSRKLVKILPIESADMCWIGIDDDKSFDGNWEIISKNSSIIAKDDKIIPCWSLVALLKFIPNYNIIKHTKKITIVTVANDNLYVSSKDNLLDACYEMILKLHGLNIL